ncbi:hypothetical protein Bca52824_029278 [Brassica carinata]|uniref:Longin domain-containing protein n=1 Tax=Brassica carinata TaxID=52824 RepID=A0A8X7VDP7_BRACI|nr:hypothetical protein Bca52824_029278 [Brassica carinata]
MDLRHPKLNKEIGGTRARFRGTVVFEEFSAVTGNTGAVVRSNSVSSDSQSLLLRRRSSSPSYLFLNVVSLYILEPSSYRCIYGRIPFSYPEDVHMRFMKNYGRVAHHALAYAMNDEFSRV